MDPNKKNLVSMNQDCCQMMAGNIDGYAFINEMFESHFTINEQDLVYQKVGRNKIISVCEFNEMLLDNK